MIHAYGEFQYDSKRFGSSKGSRNKPFVPRLVMSERTWTSQGRFTHSMPFPCRTHAIPLPCRALIHTCHAASLPCSDSTVSFVNVRMVAGNIRTASPQRNRWSFYSVLLPLFSLSMTNGVWFHTGHLHLRLVCV